MCWVWRGDKGPSSPGRSTLLGDAGGAPATAKRNATQGEGLATGPSSWGGGCPHSAATNASAPAYGPPGIGSTKWLTGTLRRVAVGRE